VGKLDRSGSEGQPNRASPLLFVVADLYIHLVLGGEFIFFFLGHGVMMIGRLGGSSGAATFSRTFCSAFNKIMNTPSFSKDLSARVVGFSTSNRDESSHEDFHPKLKRMPPTSSGNYEDLIRKDIIENNIFLYMKGSPQQPMCGFSGQVVAILQAEGVEFASRNVLENVELREAIKKFSNWSTFPQLYVRGELIGGCDIVVSHYRNGELPEILNPADQ